MLKNLDGYIIAVPTPVNNKNIPDLLMLKLACQTVGKNINKNSVVILESTVYPGISENFCIPIIEKYSKLKCEFSGNRKYKNNFHYGFCPERINPGDKVHTIDKITKVISGSSSIAVRKIKKIYSVVNKKNIFVSQSIKVAEAAKIIENTQRDLNIAFFNELSQIFRRLDINTNEVIKTAETKWNFIKFTPGLVGGHCIGVDPYYLTHLCKKIKYKPKIILSGRKVNDEMPQYIISNLKILLKNKNIEIKNSKILVVGISFKENVKDTRNSKSIEIISKLKKLTENITIYDPIVNEKKIEKIFVVKNYKKLQKKNYDCMLLLVPHDAIKKYFLKKYFLFLKKTNVILDIKGALHANKSDFSL
jgi:UDP-N-acetyl-D-galactosamine dehydrogenase